MKKMNSKGFTMVELLAVISIMGVLVLVATPMVSNIILNSRKTAYADIALSYIRSAKFKIVNKEIDKTFDSDTTYYIDVRFLEESGVIAPSPFGDWVEAYVIYTITEEGIPSYYFLSLDEEGWMIKRVEESKIDKSAVIRDQRYESVDIENLDSRGTIMFVDEEGEMYEIAEQKAWTREKTKECFSFKDKNEDEIILTYYNKECMTPEGGVVIPAKVGGKSVVEIYSYTFYNMGIKSVSIPNTVKTIGGSAFAYNQLTSIRIPNSVTHISDTAFLSNQISNLIMTDKVTYIGSRAFQHNKLDKPLKVLVPNEDATIGSCAFCNNFLPSSAFLFRGNTVRGYVGDLSECADTKVFDIPRFNNNGEPVTAIDGSAFYSMSLSGYTVNIPEGVVSIGGSAFSFDGISKVNFPSTLKTIGSHAFYSNALTEINIPAGVTEIQSTAFNNNKVPNAEDGWIYKRTTSGIDYSTIIGYAGDPKYNLVLPTKKNNVTLTSLGPSALTYLGLTGKLTIPNTITSYQGTQVFCSNSLTKVDNGDGVETDGFVFARNSNGTPDKTVLYSYAGNNKNPVIPSSVKKIGDYAFYYSYINSVTMPEGLTHIGNYAFYVCQLTGSVTIPSSVFSIGTGAFYKQINWTSMNGALTKIINKTGRAFNWQAITNGPSPATFVTGTVENWYGDIEVTAS